jgi:uncharacterized membrane protein YjdF
MNHNWSINTKQFWQRFELPVALTVLLAGTAFLLKMCYMSLVLNSVLGLVFLTAFHFYLRSRFAVKLPVPLLFLVFTALQVDALGNFFRLYGRRFGPLQYDEFSHLCVQILVTPLVIWLVKQAFQARGYPSAAVVTSLFACTIMFSLTAFYEIIELWDELYFQGQRIWSKYDTATDLQWDLLGILIGAALANLLSSVRGAAPEAVKSPAL